MEIPIRIEMNYDMERGGEEHHLFMQEYLEERQRVRAEQEEINRDNEVPIRVKNEDILKNIDRLIEREVELRDSGRGGMADEVKKLIEQNLKSIK